MICLFIDTSLVNVSISIVKDGKILAIIQKDIPNMHSVYTTKFIKDVIDKAGIKPMMIDKIMVVVGPGSFTGIRIGVTIAKTYGYLIKKDITPVSSLRALAISSGYSGLVMSLIPANKNEYYMAIYDNDKDIVIEESMVSVKKDIIYKMYEKYNPYVVKVDDEDINGIKINKVKLDVLKVVNYYIDKESVNCHKLLPDYKKLPQAVIDKIKN